jgi:hypothetical protein
MLVLADVFWRVSPIYSAIDINLWPKIESSIGSRGTSCTFSKALTLFSEVSGSEISKLP